MIKKNVKKTKETVSHAKTAKAKTVKAEKEKIVHHVAKEKPVKIKEKKEAIKTETVKPAIVVESSNIDNNEKTKPAKSHKYYEAVGRRKNAVARVRISPIKTNEMREPVFLSNKKQASEYFRGIELQSIVDSPFKLMKMVNKFDVTVIVHGSGIHSQAEAVRLGISRALLEFNKTFRKKLKRAGFLERDARKKERKKPGLKKARRAPQWQKR